MEEVRKLRRLIRLTQYELAREAGISRVRISLLENEQVEARPGERHALLQALFAIAKRREAHIRHLAENSTALSPTRKHTVEEI